MEAYLIKTDVLKEFKTLKVDFKELKTKRRELKTKLDNFIKTVVERDEFGLELLFQESETEIQKIENQVKKIENKLTQILNESQVEVRDISSSKFETSMKNSIDVTYQFKHLEISEVDHTKDLEEQKLAKENMENKIIFLNTQVELAQIQIKFLNKMIESMRSSMKDFDDGLTKVEAVILKLSKFSEENKAMVTQLIDGLKGLILRFN